MVSFSEVKVNIGLESKGISSYGSVSVWTFNTWGQVCSSFWDDKSANVLCKSKKYSGGVATVYPKTISVPVLISEYHCVGNETNFSSCKGDNGVCYSSSVAGAICYSNSGKTMYHCIDIYYMYKVLVNYCKKNSNIYIIKIICSKFIAFTL